LTDILASSGVLQQRRPARLKRPYHTFVLALMVATSTVATFDLYLFASSSFH
jgi:hypothetical protein